MLPQTDTNWFISQSFWIFLFFSFVIFFMYKFFVPKLISYFITRNSHIKSLDNNLFDLKESVAKCKREIESYKSKMNNMLGDGIFELNNEFEKKYKKILEENKEENNIIMKKHIQDLEKHKQKILFQVKNQLQENLEEVMEKICH